MAHERLHKYNTREAFPEQELDNDLCWIVKAGDHVFIRGQTGRVRGKNEISGGASGCCLSCVIALFSRP